MRKALKWTLIAVGGLLGIIFLALGVVYVWSSVKLGNTFEVQAEQVAIPSDSGSIARGRHLVTAIGKCGDCHGDNLGGKVFIDAFPLGTVIAPNLTKGRGGVAASYTDADWVRAIRHGVNREGKGLLIMPSDEYWHYSDQELGEIIAYVKSLPPADNEPGTSSVGPLGRILYVSGELPLMPVEKIDANRKRATPPPAGPTPEYGRHLVVVGGCTGCHGADLAGGRVPGTPPDWPPAANLTPHADGLGRYTKEDFTRTLRTGVTIAGKQMDAQYMPWKATSQMYDFEIDAIWQYFQTVAPKATPSE